MLTESWRMMLFGGLKAQNGTGTVTRFPTQNTAALLAYLAYFPSRIATREELSTLLWPEADHAVGRQRLRQTLLYLRQVLEPDSSLLVTDRVHIRLHPDAFTTDVAEFEASAQAGLSSGPMPQRIESLIQAARLYTGDLLSGLYNEWILSERERLQMRFQSVLTCLVPALEAAGNTALARDYGLRLVALDPLNEDAQEMAARLKSLSRSASHGGRPETVTLSAKRIDNAELQPTLQSPSLPHPLTRLFGREAEVDQILEMLTTQPRLITLTGTGGVGKTRLAVEVARRAAALFTESVWFVPLSTVAKSAHLAEAIAVGLRVERTGEPDPVNRVCGFLRERCDLPALLVLDNLEQIAADCAPILRALLRSHPRLTLLVTSRRRLLLDDETVFPVASLPVPPSETASIDALLAEPSVALFVNQARAARPDFCLTARNAPAVAQLCRLFDGIPLALELAAARAGAYTPAQLIERFENRSEPFTASSRSDCRPARHRSLQAAVEWSLDLLSPRVRGLFARLGVFHGGWTIEAAQALCDDPGVLDDLEILRLHSLIRSEEQGAAMRYDMLEPLREFAIACLSSEERERGAAHHAAHFQKWCESSWQQTKSVVAWLDQVEAEVPNLRAAFAHLLAHDPGSALRLTVTLWSFWYIRGHIQEGRDCLRSALARTTGEFTELRARALAMAGKLAWYQSDFPTAQRLYEESLEFYRKAEMGQGLTILLGDLAILQRDRGDIDQARLHAEDALVQARGRDYDHGIVYALYALGSATYLAGDFPAAVSLLQESVERRRVAGERWGLAYTLTVLASAQLQQNNLPEAVFHQEESLSLYQEFGDKQGLSDGWFSGAQIAMAQGNTEAARSLLIQSLTLREQMGNRRGIAQCFDALARVAQANGDDDEHTAQLLGSGDALRTETGTVLTRWEYKDRETLEDILRTRLGPNSFTAACQRGKNLPRDQALLLALNTRPSGPA